MVVDMCSNIGLGLLAFGIVMAVAALAGADTPKHRPSPTVEKKIDALLKKMTIEEKAGQVNQSGFGPYEKYIQSETGLGHVVLQGGGGAASEAAAKRANEIQKLAKTKSRLGIPVLIGADGILDARVADSVTFPQPVGMASTWDPDLIQKAYGVIGSEMRAVGYGRTFAPNAGIARDPRFGRTGETYGEDPFLVSRMTVAAVNGLQENGVIATLKHYAAYDATVKGLDSSAMDVSERTLREVWLQPFKAGVAAGTGSIMCAYHAVNGVPCASNKWLLTDILKDEFGFDGFVVTDFMCVDSLYNSQKVARTPEEAVKMAFEAGIDVRDHDMGDDWSARMAKLVRSGYISEKTLDNACRRALRAKFKLGIMDNPFVDEKAAPKIVGTKDHLDTTLQVARESMVLLKNAGGFLPLKKDIASIAVIGPNADNLHNQMGVWVKEVTPEFAPRMVTVLQGFRNAVSPQTKVYFAKGCDILPSLQSVTDTLAVQTPVGSQPGWQAEYFNNRELQGDAVLTRVDRKIDFDWGQSSPAPEVNADNFSARWTGSIKAPASGTYRFSMDVDDGARVYVDGNLILDSWADHVGVTSASVDLESGRDYRICIEYHESAVGAFAKLGVEMPGSGSAGIQEAVEAAKKAEVAVVVVGDAPELNAEIKDRADLNLTGHQQELVEAVYKTGTPTVVVLVNARPLTINWIAEHIPAILEAWNPGEQGGTAVAETLFGDYNPGGKLPITFPRHVGQLPVYYNYEPGQHTTSYCEGTPFDPLYAFGYGLSYTKFQYGAVKLSKEKVKARETFEVSVEVQNVGERAGDEVVQLYIHDDYCTVVRPIMELRGSRRVHLGPGEKQTVTFAISPDDLAFYNREMKRVVEPGTFSIMVGNSSRNVQTVSVEVTTTGEAH
jgi:beta-glucosidase